MAALQSDTPNIDPLEEATREVVSLTEKIREINGRHSTVLRERDRLVAENDGLRGMADLYKRTHLTTPIAGICCDVARCDRAISITGTHLIDVDLVAEHLVPLAKAIGWVVHDTVHGRERYRCPACVKEGKTP